MERISIWDMRNAVDPPTQKQTFEEPSQITSKQTLN